MQIPTLLAAQTYASAQPVQPPRPSAAPRRIESFDLTDLAAKPDAIGKTAPQTRSMSNFEVQAPSLSSPPNAPPRAEQRPSRPGSTLDIKV